MREHPFIKFLKNGKMEFTEDGFIILFHEGGIFLPSRVFNKLFLLLRKKIPKLSITIMKEIGRYQVDQALKRYMKIWQIDKMAKEDIIVKFIDILTLIGVGKVKIERIDKNLSKINIKKTILAYEYRFEYGISKTPIDFYVAGILERAWEIIFGGKYECKEIKCYAKGDDSCEFVVKRISD